MERINVHCTNCFLKLSIGREAGESEFFKCDVSSMNYEPSLCCLMVWFVKARVASTINNQHKIVQCRTTQNIDARHCANLIAWEISFLCNHADGNNYDNGDEDDEQEPQLLPFASSCCCCCCTLLLQDEFGVLSALDFDQEGAHSKVVNVQLNTQMITMPLRGEITFQWHNLFKYVLE